MPDSSAMRLQSLFSATLELPEADRESFMEQQCRNDPAMLSELRALLEMDKDLANKTIRPIAPELSKMLSTSAPAESMVGLRVGAFELREELGSGGMGSVYRAERVDGSVTQQAAIKFVRRELLDANTLRRFQIERQTLAALDHPNIARLLDAGELDDGTPYFVMEYVAGVPITDYCARAKLSVRERVQLFRLVCAAVVQAHRSLVVHRDLKPSNILVSAEGVPKLLDFGIAKPLNTDLNSAVEEQTGTAHRYFSPSYSAPEQLLGGAIGVGCDVYALGLLLYELLAGTRPFDFTALTAGQIERLVTTVPPDAPSIAASKTESTQALQRQLRGDLDGIALRCLRKAANERYASVEQLDADLGNYLEGRPVLARGGHGWYRAQKFLRRNGIAVTAIALIAVTLIGGIASFAWQARLTAQRASELAQVAQFQAEMLRQIDATRAGKLLGDDVEALYGRVLADSGVSEEERNALARDFSDQWRRVNSTDVAKNLIDSAILKPALATIDKQFANQPLVEAALRQSLADLYTKLGLFDAAFPAQERALEIRKTFLENDTPELLSSIDSMGVLARRRGDFKTAESLLREALEKRRRVLGDDHPDTLSSYSHLATSLWQQGNNDEAESLFREAMTRSRRLLGNDHPDTLVAINGVFLTLIDRDRLVEAEPYAREVLERATRTMEESRPFRLQSISNMGVLMRGMKKFPEAEIFMRQSAEIERRTRGVDHPDSAYSAAILGGFLLEQGRVAEGIPYLHQALETRRKLLGNAHPLTIDTVMLMGTAQLELAHFDEAEHLLRESMEASHQKSGSESSSTMMSTMYLSDLYVVQGRYNDAIELLTPIEQALRREFPGGGRFAVANYLAFRGRAKLGSGQFAAAEADLAEAQKVYFESLNPNQRRARRCLSSLVQLYVAWNIEEPHKGYDTKAREWQRKLDEHNSAHPTQAVPRDSVEAEI